MSSSRAYALMQYAVLRAHEQGNSTEHSHTLTRITGQHCISLDIINDNIKLILAYILTSIIALRRNHHHVTVDRQIDRD